MAGLFGPTTLWTGLGKGVLNKVTHGLRGETPSKVEKVRVPVLGFTTVIMGPNRSKLLPNKTKKRNG